MSAARRQTAVRAREAHDVEELQELAEIERQLRGSSTYADHVEVGRTAARISWETGRHNEHFRSRITASVTRTIVEAEHWTLEVVHDPLEKPEQATTQSMITVRAAGVDR